MIPENLYVDFVRLGDELERLARFSDAEHPAVTRVVFSDADLKARKFVREQCSAAGLTVREDAVGNMFARWTGSEPALAVVGTGSHIDAIPHSGRFDGTVGVLGGLEAIRALKAAGFVPRRSIELLMFTSEEPTRFGLGCLGSRLLSGSLGPEAAAMLKDSGGATLDEVRLQVGFAGSLGDVCLPANYYAAFVELHIEQGPLLERTGVPIGAVTAIAAPASLRVELQGEGGHAGAVLMPQRRDALCAAAEIITAVEAAAKATGSADTVATTGVCRVHPGAINSIPSQVALEIDIRDTDKPARDECVANVRKAIASIASRRSIQAAVTVLNADPPAEADQRVVQAIMSACRELRLGCNPMVSRAYHDSLFMARICPIGMIFIPCKDGISHRPDEYSSPEAIGHGVEVLALALAELAAS